MLRLPILAALLIAGPADDPPPPPPPDSSASPEFDSFVVIPLRVHVLSSDDLPDADCQLTDADVTRIVGKVNRVWSPAGIAFGLEAIVREPAARVRRFRVAKDLNMGRAPLGLYRLLVPDGPSRDFDGLHVYFIHDFPVNGVYMGEDFAIVRETASLRPVEGGIDEPLPRVTAHELGHALGLDHRQDRTNLLASGTTGTSLNASEIETARAEALKAEGARTAERVRADAREAESAGRLDDARRLWSWLAQLPGGQAEAAREKLRALDPPPSDSD